MCFEYKYINVIQNNYDKMLLEVTFFINLEDINENY